MTKIIPFPENKPNIPHADQLLQEFLEICAIKNKNERQKRFEVLHLSIINYLIKKK